MTIILQTDKTNTEHIYVICYNVCVTQCVTHTEIKIQCKLDDIIESSGQQTEAAPLVKHSVPVSAVFDMEIVSLNKVQHHVHNICLTYMENFYLPHTKITNLTILQMREDISQPSCFEGG